MRRPRRLTHRLAVPTAVVAVLLSAGLAACGGQKSASTTPAAPPPASPSVTLPPSPAPSATASPSATLFPASSFVSDGDLVAGWFWLRDADQEQTALWSFVRLPEGQEDIPLDLEVLATNGVNGPRGVDATFYLAWATPSASGAPGPWLGRLPVTLPNTSPDTDPVGYACAGTLTIPRATLRGATSLVIQISRSDPRKELPPITTSVAVQKSSVQIQL